MNYLFYDLETSGLCESFDQIFRYASITTDKDLNEIDRCEISIKLRPDVVPSPSALAITRLGVKDIQEGICEYEALRKIHNLFNQPNQINIGYNSLKFDNTMLRFGFYRNLLDPYTHQYKNNSFRADLMNINIIYYLYKNDVLSWSDDRPIKLENIKEANNLFEGQSHDAMVDVEVSVELARKLKSHDSRTWEYLVNGFIKNIDVSRINKLPKISINNQQCSIGVYTNVTLGYDNDCCCAAIQIGKHKTYSNQSLWLKLDYPNIADYFNNEDKTPRVLMRKEGEPSFIMPWDKSYNFVLGQDRINNVKNNITWIENNFEVFNNFIDSKINHEYDEIINLDIDASIYSGGLFSKEEFIQMKQFHLASYEGKTALLNNLNNSRIKELGVRLLFRNYTENLDSEKREQIARSIIKTDSHNGKDKPRRTPEDAKKEALELLVDEQYDNTQIKIIEDFISFIDNKNV